MTGAPAEIKMYKPSPDAESSEINLGDLIGLLIQSRWLIVSIIALFLLGGLAYAYVATPIYKADALLQVEEKKSGLADLDINAIFEADTSVIAEIEIIKSRLVLGTVIDNLKLDIIAEPAYFPVFGEAVARRASPDSRKSVKMESLEVPESLLGVRLELVRGAQGTYDLFGPDGELIVRGVVGEAAIGAITGESVSIFVSSLRGSEGDVFTVMRKDRLNAIEDLKRSLSVNEKGKGSGILSLSFEGERRDAVARNLNEIANVYVRKNVEQKSAEAEKTLEFLDEQLPLVKRDMETAELALNSYRLEKGSVDLTLETQAILETIVTVEGQLNELRREREGVIQSFTPEHPMVVALDRQIDNLLGEIASLNGQVRDLPNTQQEVLRLVRDVEVNTQLYTALLNTAQELRVVKAGTVGNVRVVDFAAAPRLPIKPRKALILFLALVLGGVAGVAVALARHALSGGVEDPARIEKQLELPVYTTVLHSKRQDRIYRRLGENRGGAILAEDSPTDVAIESLRNLRTALHFCTMEAKNNTIMIAGPSPSIGKSFISVNLAAVLAHANKKVLLIDGDMRRGRLHEYLGLQRSAGLSDFISGEISLGDALCPSQVDGLTFLPAGNTPPNPSELLLHERFSDCLAELASEFDHIIIDSPPVLAVTDASIIGQLAGTTLMVLKYGQHPMREIELAVQRLRQSGVNLRGFVMNDLGQQSQRYGSGKYTYQYDYAEK